MLHDEDFSILDVVEEVGESVTVVSGAFAGNVNTRGDVSGADYSYFVGRGVVQQLDSENLEVQEGRLKPGDVEVFFDYSTSLSGALVVGSLVSGAFFGVAHSYDIKEVVRNEGHYQVLAAKL